MFKRWLRILGVIVCVAALTACTSSKKKHFWQADVTDANQGAQSMGLGDDDGFDVLGSESFSEDQVVSGQKIYFAYNKYDVESAYNPVITANVNYLMEHPHAKIRIEGHTDEVGSREYNIALGEHRANSVKDALINQGVSRAQISTVSYGKEYPVAACVDSHKSRCQLNRRAVFIYTDLG